MGGSTHRETNPGQAVDSQKTPVAAKVVGSVSYEAPIRQRKLEESADSFGRLSQLLSKAVVGMNWRPERQVMTGHDRDAGICPAQLSFKDTIFLASGSTAPSSTEQLVGRQAFGGRPRPVEAISAYSR